MFAYCLNNPVNRVDQYGSESSNTEDANGNGIPDYLESRWKKLTMIEKARQMGERASISEGGISFDFGAEYAAFREIAYYLGEYYASEIITQSACAKYFNTVGTPFLLSDACVAYEYFEHVIAYMWAVGDHPIPNDIVIAWSISKKSYDTESVYNATVSIDIMIKDVIPGNKQAIAFGYKDGIRDCYRGTADDPWGEKR